MDFKQFLEMVNEAESTAEKDDKAEKAGKKVAKDIEYDEGHKGKDDENAEKAGKKVTKDIEYDDKKDKKSLKDWFEIIDRNMLAEAEQITMEPAKQNTQVIKQGTKTLGTVSNPALAAQIKQSIGRGEMSLAGHDMKEEAEDNPESAMMEKWAGDAEVKPTGQYKDKSEAELKSMLAKLKKTGPHDKDSPAAKKMRQINFALRAKGGWKSGEGAAMKEESMDESGLQAYLGKKKYGEQGMKALQKAGRDGASKEKMASIRAKYDKLDKAGVAEGSFKQTPGQKQYGVLHSQLKSLADSGQINTPAGKQKAEKMIDAIQQLVDTDPSCAGSTVPSKEIWLSEQGDEKAKNPYAIGMAQAMKSAGDKPPLKKSTITKAHDIAKSIKKKTSEAEIPHSGPDYGAGLGAGRSDKVLEYTIPKNKYYVVQVSIDSDEGRSISVFDLMYNDKKIQRYRNVDSAQRQLRRLRAAGKPVEMNEGSITEASKPYFLDLDNDGNKKESMKKAAAYKKKKKVDEAMNTLEAAYHEGKSHGLTKHGYVCRYDEGTDEHRRYHEGFKEGLDECYGLMPVQGLVVGETMPAATVPGMASQAMPAMEADMEEGNAFTAALARTPKGGKFSVGGKTFTDRSDYNSQIDEFAFESLDRQLNDLLNEGISVNMQKDIQGLGDDSVSVTATDDDAAKLLDFIKQVGLGGLGDDKAEVGSVEPIAAVSDYGAPKFSGHDDMMGLIKVASGEDYKDEESHERNHAHEAKMCETHGMEEAKCGCGEGKEMVDEVESEDQMLYNVAEDDGEGYTQSQAAGAEIDSALAGAMGGDDVKVSEGGDGGEASEEPEMNEEEKKDEELTEWANDAGKDGTDQAFQRDIEFMTKVIAGGLNKPKSTGQQTIPVLAGDKARTGIDDELIAEWKKLSGLR